MNNQEKFHKEYQTLSKKYGFDFYAFVDCRNSLLRFIINKLGKRAKLAANMMIKPTQKTEHGALVDLIAKQLGDKFELKEKAKNPNKKQKA